MPADLWARGRRRAFRGRPVVCSRDWWSDPHVSGDMGDRTEGAHSYASVTALIALTIVTILLLNFHTDHPLIAWHRWLQLVTIIVPLALLSSRRVQARIYHHRMFAVVTVAALVGASAVTVSYSWAARCSIP